MKSLVFNGFIRTKLYSRNCTRRAYSTQSAPKSFKLIYFTLMGRGEVTRLLFHAAGQNFEDKRVTREEWLTIKPHTPFKMCPVLEVDGVPLAESHAIERFLAGQFDLNGSTAIEAAQIDAIVEVMETLKTQYRKHRDLKTNEEKEKFKEQFFVTDFPPILDQLEAWLVTCKPIASSPWAIGNKMSLADITLYHNLRFHWSDQGTVNRSLQGRERIVQSLEATAKNSGIAKYIQTYTDRQ